MDVPRLVEGGIGAQFFGLVALPGLDRNPEATCHRQIDYLQQAAQQSEGRLSIAKSADEIARLKPGKVSALIGIEGAHSLQGDVEAVARFAARGVRYLGLLHFTANACGVPAMGWGASAHKGLTDFGHQVVERCQSVGMIVDLAHINKQGFMDVCEIAKAPVIVSHTGVCGVNDMWRNIDDEQLRAIARLGGVVGVIFCPAYLGSDGLDAVVDHLAHIINVAGEETASLGSDWDGFIRPTSQLKQASELPRLTQALVRRGLGDRVIAKILRENALRVLRDVPPI